MNMHKFTALVFFTFMFTAAGAQNIFSALHMNEERYYKTKRPATIIKRSIFHTASGKKEEKEIDVFDESGMLLTQERYDENGTLNGKMVLVNDTVNRINTAQTFERWTTYGHSKEVTAYQYDSSKFLVAIITKNAAGNVLTYTQIKNNDKGYPIEMIVFNSSGNAVGKELATYQYEANQCVTSVMTNSGKVVSYDTLKISFKNACQFPRPGDSCNDHGDLVMWSSKNLDGTRTFYESEYTYDLYGNCTEERIYKVEYKSNGKSKRKIDRIFKKEYQYEF